MAIEIEHKFLLKSKPDLRDSRSSTIKQGYLVDLKNPHLVLRVRSVRTGHEPDPVFKGFITVKGDATSNIARPEYEMAIPFAYAEILLGQCSKVLSKTRYYLSYENHVWEIDQFHGPLEGMWIAEIELASETEVFSRPNWAGADVTYVKEFMNSNLINLTEVPQVYKDLSNA